MMRYFPVTVMRGKVFVRAGRQEFQPEEAVDVIQGVCGLVGHRKVKTVDELQEAIRSSFIHDGSITIWIHEDLADFVARTYGRDQTSCNRPAILQIV